METVKYRGARIHVGCGGTVIKRRCLQCGAREEKRGLGTLIFGKGPLVRKEDSGGINREEHRKRIREGKDIFR